MSKQLENLHRHHRLRLKNRFLKNGLEGFEPHNVLELLLFFAVPQGDTNELAHILLNKFGSISDVFSAPYSELIKIKGVGDHTATMLKLMPELFKVYVKERTEIDDKKSFTVDDVAKYLVPLYIACENEVVRALYFDNRMCLVENKVIFEGDLNSANLSYKEVAKISLTRGLPNVILAHNHPQTISPIPSMEDISTTSKLKESLAMFNINLVEHIIISGKRYSRVLEVMSWGDKALDESKLIKENPEDAETDQENILLNDEQEQYETI
ncbi:MAG: hypothetical protein IJO52_05375 [Clostridia bacterium]|nr:hypothetical protein [Clostridia bacterium]